MKELTRRDVAKAATIAGIVGLTGGATASAAQDDGTPKGWGAEGDQSFKVTLPKGYKTSAIKSDNCGEKKREIEDRFQVVRFGSCDHPTPVDADVEAAEKMAEVIADGGILNTEFGHRTVKHKNGPISFNTYLAYAGGDRP